ncbi:ectoine/hydroxyectoine ABC transporter permease subunit EhuC [Paenibacillus hodogayensis]|uniref:Ectoine/hydroxyectoine ABC transporter permease subunit EhuC n=1 Tax=Paenibacillus hodogayensis TaxID=279208 RepID=A0ABV5VU44_9BACL
MTSAIAELLPALRTGTLITLKLTVLATAAALLMSVLAALLRRSRWKAVRVLAAAYVETFRGTSLLVQLFWLYYAFPLLLDIRLPVLTVAVLALGLNYGAYGSEVVRSALEAVPKGQTEAAIALNMSPFQRLRRIIGPQALAIALPSLGNLQIELLKGTSLVSLITLGELTYQGMLLRTYDMSRTTLIFGLILLLYFLIAQLLLLVVRLLERRFPAGRVGA